MRLGDLWAKHGGGALQPDSAETKDLFIFGVTDDSREVRHGYLFCALPGTKDDGLAFCSQAAAKGAKAIVVSEYGTLIHRPAYDGQAKAPGQNSTRRAGQI